MIMRSNYEVKAKLAAARGRLSWSHYNMRYIILSALIAFASSLHGATLQIPTDGRVIIPGRWRPSGGYMDVALRCAAWFVEHPDVSDRYALSQIALIRQHAGEYRVQFIGTFRNGNTVLLCN